MITLNSINSYIELATSRRKSGRLSGLPEELTLSLADALSILASQDDSYKHAAIVGAKDQIADPALADVATLCVRFGNLLAPIRSFMMATSGYALNEIRTPIHQVEEIDRKRSMLGTCMWVCDKFCWPLSKTGAPLSPLMQLNLQELHTPLLSGADFPDVLVQVWGDKTTPVVRTIPLSEIEHSSPERSVPNWENEHLYYGVTAEATGSAKDIQCKSRQVLFGEYIGVGTVGPFTVSRDVFSFGKEIRQLETLLEDPLFASADSKTAIMEVTEYLNDFFESAMFKYEQSHESDCHAYGYFFGDTKLRQTFYRDWFDGEEEWHGGGWKPLYQPINNGESLPGLSIFWDGEITLFWRSKGGSFEFHAEADR